MDEEGGGGASGRERARENEMETYEVKRNLVRGLVYVWRVGIFPDICSMWRITTTGDRVPIVCEWIT